MMFPARLWLQPSPWLSAHDVPCPLTAPTTPRPQPAAAGAPLPPSTPPGTKLSGVLLQGLPGWGACVWALPRPSRAPHLHTYTSFGGWVLGVMIQGATRKTTLSWKSRLWGSSCGGGEGKRGAVRAARHTGGPSPAGPGPGSRATPRSPGLPGWTRPAGRGGGKRAPGSWRRGRPGPPRRSVCCAGHPGAPAGETGALAPGPHCTGRAAGPLGARRGSAPHSCL